jgi:chromosome segregation ATPase
MDTLQDQNQKKNASIGEGRNDASGPANAAYASNSTREAMARLESTSLEVDIMRKQLASANKALAEAERVAEAAREALAEEEQKNMQLQVQVSELKKDIGRIRELEREIQRYRLRESSNDDGVKGKRTGFWGYIAGSDRVE